MSTIIRKQGAMITMVERDGTVMPDGREPFLKRLRAVNVLRAAEDFKTYDNAGILYFTTSLAGEVGELCNLIKKLERHKIGGPDHGHTTKIADITPEKIRDEIGGIQIYLDLLASLLDTDIEEAVTETFNNVSVKIDSKYRL
jgi:NTP pyrophosphatase (non-canonical NTP hydrolase)